MKKINDILSLMQINSLFLYAGYFKRSDITKQSILHLIITAFLIFVSAPAIAQNVGIGTTTPQAKLDVNGQIRISGGNPGVGKVLTSDASGIASWQTPLAGPFTSTGGITSNLPLTDHFVFGSPFLNDITGSDDNIRMYFNKSKGVFRAGEAYATDWDEANAGDYSVAMGYKTRAPGKYSSAFGSLNTAEGWYSTSMGYGTLANAINAMAIGKYNVGQGNPNSWVAEDPIFEIGIGSSQVERRNALTVLKNGNVGIGQANPAATLEVAGQMKITGGSPGIGKVLTSDATGLASWQMPSVGFSLPYSGDCSSVNAAFAINQSGTGQGIYVYNPAETGEVTSISAHNNSSSGMGISAYMHAATGAATGISGSTQSASGIGVKGVATAATGLNHGVIGESKSVEGTGVYGLNSASTGTGFGVLGIVNSGSAFSGFFSGGKFYISGNTGIGTASPSAKLEVNGQIKITGGNPGAGKVLTSDAGGLASWQSPAGTPFSSAGGITSNTPITDHLVFGSSSLEDAGGTGDDIRLFFNKTKGAFRAGRATGTEWNVTSVGNYSAAFGDNSKASGNGSFASGVASVASGSTSTAMGNYVNANAMLSTAIGSYNVGAGTKDSWVETDPIFEIGNGTMDAARSNALTVLKNGNTGIGSTSPAYKLDVYGNRIRLYESATGDWIAMRTDGGSNDYLDFSWGGGSLVMQGATTNENIILNPSMNKVGIRTWSPMYDLDVTGNIRATGSVYYGGTAGSANGILYTKPDYVFAEEYQTMTVSQVEDFLKHKKHLPWVTSAEQEKMENGEATDMTRMAFETLESVENLQLQIISQQKLIKVQQTLIESLQTRLEHLEKILKKSK